MKIGKRLVWSKGVSIPNSRPSPIVSRNFTPSPTQTEVPTPVPSKSSTPLPSPSPSFSQTSPPRVPTSFDDLIENYRGITYAAWSKSRDKILNSLPADISIKLNLGPTSKLTYNTPLDPIKLITRLYAGFARDAELNFLAFNFDDRDWAENEMEKTIPNSGSRWIKSNACKTVETCWGGGAFSDGKDKYLIVIAIGFIDNNHTSGTVEAHEFTHILQQMNMKLARPAQEFIFDPWPPDWYWEGQAQFAQHASVYFNSYQNYLKERNAASEQLFRDDSYNSEFIEKYFVFNAPTSWQKTYEPWRKYDLGAMFVEILTALKGPDSTMEMWRIASTGVNFDIAFERVYGTPFSKALPIISKAIALELGRNN